MQHFSKTNYWCLILGGSSGFGLATAKKLEEEGMNIFLVHKDRQGAMAQIEWGFDKIKATGVKCIFLNKDALSESGRTEIVNQLEKEIKDGKIRLMLHSIAYANLKLVVPYTADSEESAHYNNNFLLDEEDYASTIYAMGTSLGVWARALFDKNFFSSDARIIGLTSEGSSSAWRGYAAVSMAKGVLENISRSLALELAPYGIRSNIIQAGFTDTPALRLMLNNKRMSAFAKKRNPFKRLTTPEDVANVIYLLCRDESSWINGTIVRVDGGEYISGGLVEEKEEVKN